MLLTDGQFVARARPETMASLLLALLNLTANWEIKIMAIPAHTSASGYAIIIAGLVLVFISALVPFYNSGYQLKVDVILAGLLPYLSYGIAVVLLHRRVTTVVGVVLLGAHAWLVVRERFIDNADYSDFMIYYVPIVLALLLIPLVIMALRQPCYE